MIIEILIFFLTFIPIYMTYSYFKTRNYYDSKGIKYTPGYPIFGNAFNTITNRGNIINDIDKVYKTFPDEKYVVYIEGVSPLILIRDPEIIKNVAVKDFDYFINRREIFSEADDLLGGSLLTLKEDKWRNMRATLSPAFTGIKIKRLMPLMTQTCNNVIEYLHEFLKNESDIVDLDDIMRRYTNDVIASAAFGYEVNSFIDKNNDFFTICESLFKFDLRLSIVLYCVGNFPWLARKLKLQSLPPKTVKFFQGIVSKTIKYRRKNNIERSDVIQLLMETGKDWSNKEITGQIFLFFFAGFESAADALAICVHELALNPDVQEKLYQEIKSFKETTSEITYENIKELKYMSCVLNEVSRKWTPAIALDRTCTRAYTLPPPSEGAKPYRMRPGEIIYCVVNSLHMDPKYFPDPHIFDPERFSDENKEKITPFTFMPFGVGPRICIGYRFALLEMKILLYNFVLNFKACKCNKTTNPIKLSPGFIIKAQGGSWVRLEPRNKQ